MKDSHYSKNKDYLKEYYKNKYKSVLLRFRVDDEEEKKMLKHVKNVSNTSEYIKALIRNDMK